MQIIRLKQHGIILALLLYSITLACQEFKVVSYNIKYDNPADAENNWKDRKVAMAELLHELEPAFIGVQEARRHQLMFLDSSLASFSYIGVARDDGKTKGEYSAILYDTLRSNVLK
ncbi:MAG TPA: endonuclease/exonuclease/phosphatase, partial [Bacteroidales bacterium]|nr:endonuclease/exonuclease/phosphatase [Bacteroidales bacterium]